MRFVGSVCSFSCPTGYLLQGPSSVECSSSHAWSTKILPDCKAQIKVSSWIVLHGMAFDPAWRIMFSPPNPTDVYLDVDQIDCETIDGDVYNFIVYLESNKIVYNLSDLEIFYTACNGAL